MRRPISPRQSVAIAFDRVVASANLMKSKITTPEQHTTFEIMSSCIDDAREFAIISAVEAAPVKGSAFGHLLESRDPEKIALVLGAYLSKQLELVKITDKSVHAGLLDGLKSDKPLEEIVADAFAHTASDVSIPFNHYMAEAILREALGLDGHKPDLEVSPDDAAARAWELRVAMGASIPWLAQTNQDEPLSEAARAPVDALISSMDIGGAGLSRDELFFVAIENLVRDTKDRIEALMGGEVSSEHLHLLGRVIEGISNHTGPQLSFENLDPEEPSL